MMEKSKHKIVYKIYEVTENGLLKEPKSDYWGHKTTAFDEYDTQNDALIALDKKEKWGEYTILPVAVNDFSG